MGGSACADYSEANNTEANHRIAFTSDQDGNAEVYVVNSDGTGQTNLTNSSGDDAFPAFSPDGTRIAFISDRDGNLEIYVMNSDGTDQTNLTNEEAGSDIDPVFSPAQPR